MSRPRGRPPLLREIFSISNPGLIPPEVTLDTSFVVEALSPSQAQHVECSEFLLSLLDGGTLLIFNRVLELELAETAFRIALKERWGGRDWSRRRLDGRARARAARLATETRTAWQDILTAFPFICLEPGEVGHLVPDLMARHGLGSYDAVHAATAIYSNARDLVTRDSDFALLPARDLKPRQRVPPDQTLVSRRLDFVRFRVGDDELEVAFTVVLERAERATRAPDEAARTAAARIRGAGASRPITLTAEESAALGRVIDQWEAEALTVRRLRERLP